MHVWRLPLQDRAADLTPLFGLLPKDERHRASRFHFDTHRTAYVLAHGMLRLLLARYLSVATFSSPFLLGAYGKPRLDSPAQLRFNLAHSGGLALAAFAEGTEIGVDLEQTEGSLPVEEVAEHYFSLQEQHAIALLPAERKRAGFFHVWSQKEAYLKGRGDGVTQGLDHFDVQADPTRPAALLADRHDPAATGRWQLHTLDAGPGFRAVLAVERKVVDLRYFDWPCQG